MPLLKSFVLAAALLSGAASASDEFPNVTDSSFTEANGDRTIQLSVTIAAPPEKVFAALSTPEGWMTWAVPWASGEVRVGGLLETSYNPAAKPGDAGNIINEFIAWLPNRLVVMRNVKAPQDFENAAAFQKTATIIELVADPAGTKVTLSGTGFRAEPAYDGVYKGFSWGNAYSLENLKKAIETGPLDWATILKE